MFRSTPPVLWNSAWLEQDTFILIAGRWGQVNSQRSWISQKGVDRYYIEIMSVYSDNIYVQANLFCNVIIYIYIYTASLAYYFNQRKNKNKQ